MRTDKEMYRLIDGKGRVYLPKEVRDMAGISCGDIMKLAMDQRGKIEIRKAVLIEIGDQSLSLIHIQMCIRDSHNNTIRLSISKGFEERKENETRYYGYAAMKDSYIDLEMSYSQFAEAITSIGMGEGVPVTIRTRQSGGRIFEHGYAAIRCV